jgi:hypothetical protein
MPVSCKFTLTDAQRKADLLFCASSGESVPVGGISAEARWRARPLGVSPSLLFERRQPGHRHHFSHARLAIVVWPTTA